MKMMVFYLCFLFAITRGQAFNVAALEWPVQPDDVTSGSYDHLFLPSGNKDEPRNGTQDHLCARECNGETKICYYRFLIEHFSTLGYACGNCQCNNNGCTGSCNNNNCIVANGVRRNIITVNKRLPGPPIYVCKGDRIIVDVTNMLQGKVASLHWHGVYQRGSPWMDGVSMVSQCPIIPGNTFRYDFIASQGGTHYWHDHAGLIKLDGVQGPLIVREPKSNTVSRSISYDLDLPSHVMFLNDWKSFMSDQEFPQMTTLPSGRRIESILVNGKGVVMPNNLCDKSPMPLLAVFKVTKDNVYRFRIVGAFCMMCAIELQIEEHAFTVIAVDGNPIKPAIVTSLVIASGERYDIVVPATQVIDNYWIYLRGVDPCNGTAQRALLSYDSARSRRMCKQMPPTTRSINHPDMSRGKPFNFKISDLKNDIVDPTDQETNNSLIYTFTISSHPYSQENFTEASNFLLFLNLAPNVIPTPFRSTINGISSSMPAYPLFSQYQDMSGNALCSGECVNGTSEQPCKPCVHLIKLPLNRTVDFILADPSNYTGIVHPFHLHGHTFKVLEQGPMDGTSVENLRRRLENGEVLVRQPPVRDTILLPQGSYAIVRWFTDNPGIWIFHCHYIYHNAVGMHVYLQVGEYANFVKPPGDFPKCGNYKPRRNA